MHIDPFAPGDSPQHPANFGKAAEEHTPVADSPEVVRYRELLEQYGTAEEQQLASTAEAEDDELPELDELEARADGAAVYRLRLDAFGTEEEKQRDDWSFWQLHERFDFGTAPAATAVKADWVSYTQRVAAVRGEDIPRDENGEPGTIAQLKEYASHAFDLPEGQE